MRSSRNNLLAGSMVVLCITAAVVVVVLLAGGLERLGKHDYLVRFGIADGVSGLEPGSRVMVGGRPVGVVKGLKFDIGADGRAEAVQVTISIDRKLTLREGAVAYLISPLLGGSGQINFPSVGTGTPIASDQLIEGAIAPPTLLAQAGYGEEQRQQVQNIIRRINDASEKLDNVLETANSVITDVRGKWPDWSARVDSITKNIDETTAKGPQIATDLQGRLDELKEMFTTAQGYLDENRENVKEGISSFRAIGTKGDQFMDRLNTELADKTAQFLDDAKAAFETARLAVERIDLLRTEQLPNIRRMLSNFRLASDQLTAMMAEVRRSPWRLLYRPDKRELDFELLYDSTRSYAAAVSDLRNAGESLNTLRAATNNPDPARIDGMIAQLEEAFERYKEAEAEFLRQIMLHGSENEEQPPRR